MKGIIAILLFLFMPVLLITQASADEAIWQVVTPNEGFKYASSPPGKLFMPPASLERLSKSPIEARLTAVCRENSQPIVMPLILLSPNITLRDVKEIEGSYQLLTRMKWDDQVDLSFFGVIPDRILLVFIGGVASISDKTPAIEKIKKHNEVTLELDIEDEGRIYITFPLKGATKAINSLIDYCNN